jgi:hypothetical protein
MLAGKMTRGKYNTGWLAAAGLAMSFATVFPCAAQKGAFRAPQQHHAAPAYQAPRAQARPGQNAAAQRGHAGDWLRKYKDMPPAEQERALRSDPAFQHLGPQQQQQLRERLQHFSNLPPQQQLRMLNRMETWEHLTPAQQQQARQVFSQIKQLPPNRQRMVTTAIHDLRAMPPEQREQIINSDRFKGMFSDQERDMMRGAARLPLAPAEGPGD